MKTLSIIIPTYNLEALLPLCLDSIVASKALPRLDVVVVNDGSRDGSLAVAKGYAKRYADSVRVIDKPNGNYGSTINAALPILEGKYVKILDADDAFDTAALDSYVEYLEQISGADMVVGPYVEITREGERKVDYNLYSKRVYGIGVPYNAEQIFGEGSIRFFAMHSVAYRTELLREMEYRQTEGVSYTDQEWCFYPLFRVDTIAFTEIALYRYNLAREGQTMDSVVQLKNISHLTKVVEKMALWLDGAEGLSGVRYDFLAGVVMRRMQTVLRKYLLEMEEQQFVTSDFEKVVALFKLIAPEKLTVMVNGALPIDLLARWQSKGRRYSYIVRKILMTADRLMQRVYKLIF